MSGQRETAREPRRSKKERAIDVLLELLADGGWHLSGVVHAELERHGLSARNGELASAELGVRKRKQRGPGGRYEWRLPDGASLRQQECGLCGTSFPAGFGRRFCGVGCRREADRLVAILRGKSWEQCSSFAARLQALGRPSAVRRLDEPASALTRTLRDAGYVRAEPEAGKT